LRQEQHLKVSKLTKDENPQKSKKKKNKKMKAFGFSILINFDD